MGLYSATIYPGGTTAVDALIDTTTMWVLVRDEHLASSEGYTDLSKTLKYADKEVTGDK